MQKIYARSMWAIWSVFKVIWHVLPPQNKWLQVSGHIFTHRDLWASKLFFNCGMQFYISAKLLFLLLFFLGSKGILKHIFMYAACWPKSTSTKVDLDQSRPRPKSTSTKVDLDQSRHAFTFLPLITKLKT